MVLKFQNHHTHKDKDKDKDKDKLFERIKSKKLIFRASRTSLSIIITPTVLWLEENKIKLIGSAAQQNIRKGAAYKKQLLEITY